MRRALPLLFVAALVGACSTGSPTAPRSSGRISVVAAEDFWGSIARQLAGDRADVQSLITNPATDPHDYEPTAGDARAVATARVVITNGIGYDPWIDKLLAANPAPGRIVLQVGELLGLKEGDNPHQWYSPAAVDKVIGAVVEHLRQADPAHAGDYDRQRATFEATLAPYRDAVTIIKRTYADTPIGATESIVSPLAGALGLQLVTPPAFLDAISEGSDPTSADKTTVDRQIRTKAIKVFVFNSQNATPDVQRLVEEAKTEGIPIVTVTETLTPKGASFQDWQTRQLDALRAALASETGR